ncbi:hypothetical protein LP417_35400 (plasmid) [Polaromonas sp. P1-6]|nr:hypothetical protein LP417_35400 [Polaromonas sp. P1-6]
MEERKCAVRRAYFAGVSRNVRALASRRKRAIAKAFSQLISPFWFGVICCLIVVLTLTTIAEFHQKTEQKRIDAEAAQATAALRRAKEEQARISGPELLTDFNPDEGIVLKLSKTSTQPDPQEKELP